MATSVTRFYLVFTLCLMTAGLLSACAPATTPEGYAVPRKSLVSYNYSAVDTLMSRAGRAVTKDTPMLVGTIGNVNDVESSSTLGRAITEQVSARLAQKGYKVAELKLRQGISIQESSLDHSSTGEYLLSRDVRNISGEHKAAAAVAGTYALGADNVLVNLRLLDIRTGNVITAYDYTLPKTADIASMTNDGSSAAPGFFSRAWDY